MSPDDDDDDDESFLDILEEGVYADDEGDGLELDESQAREIRHVFLTTLPQYLEPVEQMLEQLLADGADAGVLDALETTLSSIGAAAARLGIEDICDALEIIGEQVTQLHEQGWSDPELRRAVMASLRRIERIAAGTVGDSIALEGELPEKKRGETLVTAFRDIEGIDPSALQRLTAAGIVSVDQLQMARPHEIVAVSGLSARGRR